MPQHPSSDDNLMRAAAVGDAAAFAEIVKRHQGWVRSLMLAFVHHAEQAEDLSQDVFCRAFQNVASYEPQGQFTAWLKRIAVNRAKDHLRRQKQATLVPLDEWEELPATDRRGDPLAVLATGALRDDLRCAIERLPDEQRLALVMYYFGDMSLQDIGWALKCPVGTVKSRLFYALRRVRQMLTTIWNEEGNSDNER
jgi:RNA polymerase sigma-70 factor, ECF subfamily